ncbi:GNAT family N-acetyltransferase [Halodesulfovibrio aestuarii]|uniref:GNAT family N-acetyltransferase n=1 Tax=Halodesulfovibrio aestuarii TaxID=126333 RepID=A0ABV4JQA9_9BACT
MNVTIRQTDYNDLPEIMRVEEEAFGYPKEARLVNDLLNDPTAEPRLSLLAFNGDEAVGHILFTAVKIEHSGVTASILAPLAVVPKAQKIGIGGMLINAGLRYLKKAGVSLVFVLGHPTYYPKYGFAPVHPHAISAPYPIPEEHNDAWMMQILDDTEPSSITGTVAVSDQLGKPEHWRE